MSEEKKELPTFPAGYPNRRTKRAWQNTQLRGRNKVRTQKALTRLRKKLKKLGRPLTTIVSATRREDGSKKKVRINKT